jgi:hypothetical protein
VDGDSGMDSDKYPAATANGDFPELPGYRDGEEPVGHHELDSGYRGEEMEGIRDKPAIEMSATGSPEPRFGALARNEPSHLE